MKSTSREKKHVRPSVIGTTSTVVAHIAAVGTPVEAGAWLPSRSDEKVGSRDCRGGEPVDTARAEDIAAIAK